MTRAEVKMLYDKTCDAYPMFKPSNPQATFDLWAIYLSPFEYEVIDSFLDDHIMTNEYAPGINQLVNSGKNKHGFRERRYTHEDFVEMEKVALEEWK